MVCKEDVLLWFKDLDSYKRIDVLYDLLKMCLPFELRFLGSCVEEIGKHSYQELRGPALLANDYDKLTKDSTLNQNLLDDSVRHRILLYLSLLGSRNYIVANWLFKNYLRTECGLDEFLLKTNVKSDFILSEFLLLYTMALHHPAFNFEQKMYFGNLLNRLVEHKTRFSPKPTNILQGYPPGLDFPTQKNMNTVENITPLPVKTNMTTMSYGDLKVQLPSLHPIGAPPPLIDYATNMWNRPVHCGAPEVPPFPPPPSISPLVSHAGTPTHSRCGSPPRTASTVNIRMPLLTRPPPPAPILPNVELLPPPPPIPIEPPLIHSSLPTLFGNTTELKLPEDELSQLQDTQLVDTPWVSRGILPTDPLMKPPNGLCYPPTFKMPAPYLIEQIQALNLEGENSLHHSNSSSNSSLNQTPPETPTVTPHGPGRGVDKNSSRVVVNGIPPPPPPSNTFINNLPPLCDTTPPPPQPPQQQQPPPAFNNCTVPYTSYPASFNQIPPSNRSIFQYTTPAFCRPHFNNPYHNYQSSENTIPQYTVPYVSLIYSSPQYPARPPTGCYNCGAARHIGNDCTAQNIEEITQKKTYTLDYNTTIRDAEK